MGADCLVQAREAAASFLRENRAEIAHSALARVHSVADDIESDGESAYAAGLRATVCAALDYGVAVIESRDEDVLPPPGALLDQARLAAVNGISLDTVLRRYIAGFTMFSDYVVKAVQAAEPTVAAALPRLLQTQATHFDRLVAAVSEEYNRVRDSRFRSAEQRRTERVKRLLAGEPVDSAELGYDFDAWHLGAVVTGPGAPGVARDILRGLGRGRLMVSLAEDLAWVWLGASQRRHLAEIDLPHFPDWPQKLRVTLGEPAFGLTGWRLTHRQAKAALTVALRGAEVVVRYPDVALLASMLRDEVLSRLMLEEYIAPLAEERDGGETLLETLRAYFSTERNMSSAAALLGVSRQTVANRLSLVEERTGCTLRQKGLELELALRLHEVGGTVG